jgi:hypothetical protein
MKKYLIFLALPFFGLSCQPQTVQIDDSQSDIPVITMQELPGPSELFYPVDRYSERLTFKEFGQEVHDRFNGFHTGDDLEIFEDELEVEIPVYAVADGNVVYKNWISGYGGVIILEHNFQGQLLQSLYGHIDLNQTSLRLGESVTAGTLISYLGDHESRETDQERKHLHFSLYSGTTLRLNGYTPKTRDLVNWVNPSEFLAGQSASAPNLEMSFPDDWEKHSLLEQSELYALDILLPSDWEAQYIENNESIAIAPIGDMPILERTNIFIRYFDASDFLTLSTVTIHERNHAVINNHDVVEYVIEKKSRVKDFPNQPSWRNDLHTVTDIREQDGQSRFYVIAQNPKLDDKTVYYILNSIQVLDRSN